KGIEVRSHSLVHIDSQGSVELFCYSRYIRKAQIIRLHHDRDDGYGNMQLLTPLCLLVDECPIAWSALCILLRLRCVIKRELDGMEGTEFLVLENSNTMTIGSDGELRLCRLQVAQYRLEVGVHAVLPGAEIHRSDGQALHGCFHLI